MKKGAVAQLGERVVRNDEVAGSTPVCSTKSFPDNLPHHWRSLLENESQKKYFLDLQKFLCLERKSSATVYPSRENILRAIQSIDFPDVRVVILGQDPYHGENQAMGLSFAVPNDLRVKPPSLQNIFKEIKSDLGIELDPKLSDLTGWVSQGVLLLNTVLTVRKGQPFSHRDKGWEVFTDQIIQHLNARTEPLIFVLWGAAAQKKKLLITSSHHYVLESPHPSPFSADRGFFGCKHFSKINHILSQKLKSAPIDWSRISQS